MSFANADANRHTFVLGGANLGLRLIILEMKMFQLDLKKKNVVKAAAGT